MNKAREVDQTVTLYNKATGEPIVRLKVDAREIVKSGAYDYNPPAPVVEPDDIHKRKTRQAV